MVIQVVTPREWCLEVPGPPTPPKPPSHWGILKLRTKLRIPSGKCLTPTQLLICSSFSRENGHLFLICSSLSTSQPHISVANCQMEYFTNHTISLKFPRISLPKRYRNCPVRLRANLTRYLETFLRKSNFPSDVMDDSVHDFLWLGSWRSCCPRDIKLVDLCKLQCKVAHTTWFTKHLSRNWGPAIYWV